jgi:hypothetical protein
VAPEAVDGGPISLVRDGDRIRLDVRSRTLDLLVDDAELAARRQAWQPLPPVYTRGVLAKYAKLVGSSARRLVGSSARRRPEPSAAEPRNCADRGLVRIPDGPMVAHLRSRDISGGRLTG